MKLIVWWRGTDTLTLVKNPPGRRIWYLKLFFYRLKWKLLMRFFDEIWVNHLRLADELRLFGVKREMFLRTSPLFYPNKVQKKVHEGINVLYYCPTKPVNLGGMKFLHWLYGWEIYLKLKEYFTQLNFIHVDGTLNMYEVYPLIDIYIRPIRHEGDSRMIRECKLNNISVITSDDFNPTFEYFKNEIEKLIKN